MLQIVSLTILIADAAFLVLIRPRQIITLDIALIMPLEPTSSIVVITCLVPVVLTAYQLCLDIYNFIVSTNIYL